MPYFQDPDLKNEQDEEINQPKISGASPSVDPGGGGGKQQSIDKTGSGFQNLDNYLKGDTAKQFGQQVVGNVQNTVNQVGTDQNKAVNQFKQTVDDQSKTPGTDQIQSAVKNAGANTTADQAKQYQDWMKQSYQGPKSLAESPSAYAQFAGGTNKALAESNALGSEAGRFSLLDSYFGRPSYNFGEKSLDNLYVQQSGQGKNIKNVQNQAASLQAEGAEKARDLQNYAGQAVAKVSSSAEQARNEVGNALGQQYQQVQDKVAAANTQRKADQAAIQQALASRKLTPDQLASLGIEGNPTLYNLDLNKYLTLGQDLNKNDVMSTEDRARYQALSQLAGTTDDFTTGSANPTAAYSFDVNRFNQDAQATGRQYQNDIGNVFNQVKANAPLATDYLNSINPNSNPAEILSTLSNELGYWNNDGSQYGPERRQVLSSLIDQLVGVMHNYGVDTRTGNASYLQTGTLPRDNVNPSINRR
jgi:hypothetical protein